LLDDGAAVVAGRFIPVGDIRDGKVHFAPNKDANGAAAGSFAFQVQDDGGTANGGADLDSTPKTMAFNVTPINDAPSFVKGGDQDVMDKSGPQAVDGWAKEIVAGPPDEVGQKLNFVVIGNSNTGLFAEQPAIDSAGRLTFTPAVNVSGSAEIQIVLHDDGGAAKGGNDTSEVQTFSINVGKLRPAHNEVLAADVTGDGMVAPDDAVAIINFINAFGSRRADDVIPPWPWPFFCDVNGDGFIAPNDVVEVINRINAAGAAGEGEAGGVQRFVVAGTDVDDVMTLLAADVAGQGKRKS
jgi:hypothetical protein